MFSPPGLYIPVKDVVVVPNPFRVVGSCLQLKQTSGVHVLGRFDHLPPCGCSSDGRASVFQTECRRFDSDTPLTFECQFLFGSVAESVDAPDLKSVGSNPVRVQVPLLL